MAGVPDRRGADLPHGGLGLPPQDLQHTLDAQLTKGAEPPRYGRPTPTALAPIASALTMSVPRRKPLSIKTGMRPFSAATISVNMSIVAGTPSLTRPPWFETTTASTPCSAASTAS
jgi:hypothetical protein